MLESSQFTNLRFKNESLVIENRSLHRQNSVLNGCVWGMLALSAVLAGYSYLTASHLKKVRIENTDLQRTVAHFQKDATDLALENQDLKHYAKEANAFLNTIVMEIKDPANFETSEDTELSVLEKAEKMVKVESKQYEAERDAALKTLGIGDEKSKATLMRLRETPRGL